MYTIDATGQAAKVGQVDISLAGRNFEVSTVELFPYAILTVGGKSGLYDITLFTGQADLAGHPGKVQVTDLAFAHNQL